MDKKILKLQCEAWINQKKLPFIVVEDGPYVDIRYKPVNVAVLGSLEEALGWLRGFSYDKKDEEGYF